MVLLEKFKRKGSIGRNWIRWKIILKRIFKFGWEEVKLFGLSQFGQWICFCVNGKENLFPQKGEGSPCLYEKVSSLSTPLQITQFINTYIDPVCPYHLKLRYCSCNTYLLHRRAELKAAPSSTCLMRNCTVGNNEPLAVPTYIPLVISCCA
jgi:hypothetical protein